MVGIHEISDNELREMLATCAAGESAYICAMDELAFRDRHPEYRVA